VAARGHADRWLEAWNAHDLDAVMSCYAEDIEFVAQTVVERWGRPDGRLHGRDELRRHFSLGLGLAPDLAFREEALLVAPGGYALIYRRENGNQVIDAVELDVAGLACRVRAYYQQPQS
jgi:hypothetical protein